jgi:glycosyltransferase involved in cell wall biosynthesis
VNSTSEARAEHRALRVLVLVPAYNEAESLPPLLTELTSRYPDYEVVVINDGSTDGTEKVVRGTSARLVSLPCNLGIGGAMQTGFRIARDEGYEVAVQVDGDGQHPPEQVHALVDGLLQSGSDMAIGSRFLTRSGYQSTLGRRLGIRFFSLWLSALCRTRITDPTSGFRAVSRRGIELLARNYAEDYPEVEAIVVCHRAGLRLCEVAVQMSARTEGQSSIRGIGSLAYMVKVSLSILMCSIRAPEGID